MLRKTTIIALLTVAILTGCKKEAPKCSDKEVVEVARDLIYNTIYDVIAERMFPTDQRGYSSKEELKVQMKALHDELYKVFPNMNKDINDHKLESIVTTGFNKDTGAYTCKGDFVTYNKQTSEKTANAEMNYKVELTDDGKQFLVTIIN